MKQHAQNHQGVEFLLEMQECSLSCYPLVALTLLSCPIRAPHLPRMISDLVGNVTTGDVAERSTLRACVCVCVRGVTRPQPAVISQAPPLPSQPPVGCESRTSGSLHSKTTAQTKTLVIPFPCLTHRNASFPLVCYDT